MQKNCITPLLWAEKSSHATFKKTPIIMKSLFFACLIGSAGLVQATNMYAQTTTVSLHVENQTVGDVLQQLESKTGFSFFYNNRHVDLNRRVSVSMNETNIFKILDAVFDGTDVTYQVVDNRIVLSKRNEFLPLVQQSGKKITGTVLDVTGMPVIGANVMVKGTTNGTITDMDGKFTLEVPKGATLNVSYIGYLTTSIPIDNKTNYSITLKEDVQGLEEVVVIGYGTVRKVDLAGSVSILNNKSFKDQPILQVSDALQGRVSGVQVQSNGVPGGDIKIRIRGTGSINRSNDPLYVVDGIVRESGLTGLNPEDIQSIQVLKDASSTAIYGSRGANGVVLITTKTGKVNVREIMFDAQVGIGTVAKRYETLSPYEFATAYNTYMPNTFSQEQLTAFQNGTIGTDWQDAIYQNGITQNYKLSLTNGNEKTQFFVSANYMEQETVIIEKQNQRYQTRANLTSQIFDWVHLTADINASHNIKKGATDNIAMEALNFAPVLNIYDTNGDYTKNDPYSAILSSNPVGVLKENKDEVMSDIVNAHIDLKFNIIPGLTFTTTNGVNYSDQKTYSFRSMKVEKNHSSMSNYDAYNMTLQTTNNLTYNGKWGDHALTATAVYEATMSEYRSMGITGTDLTTESVGWWNAKMAETRDVSNSYSKWALISGVARIMYNYKDRYLLTGTFRADGSSKFTNEKWGYFPSIAAAWSIGNEKFMQQQNLIQNLKLRASYGLVGSQAINPYETLGLMAQTGYAFGGTNKYTGYWPSQSMATPDLTWEKTHQLDIGVDFSILNDRINFSFDYFNKLTKDGLLRKNIPEYDGGGTYWVNAGEIKNCGLDISVDAQILEFNDFSWNSMFTGSYLKNKVKSLGGQSFIDGTTPYVGLIQGGVNRVQVGQPVGALYGYIWTGLDKNGLDSYADLDNDGVFGSGDRTFIGKSTPDFTLGWNNSLHWKNWDLNIFFTGAFGADRLNLTRFITTTQTGNYPFITLKEAWEDSYDKKGESARYPSVTAKGNNNQAGSTKYLESADYVRLDNITLSYTLPKKIIKFTDLRFSLSCQNLFTITGYKGLDPSGVTYVSSNTSSIDVNDGIDMGVYPVNRSYTFGIRMNF